MQRNYNSVKNDCKKGVIRMEKLFNKGWSDPVRCPIEGKYSQKNSG